MKKLIPSSKVEQFNNIISKLNKKLVKFGKPELEVKELNRVARDVVITTIIDYTEHQHNQLIEFIEFEITDINFFKKDDKPYRYIGTINYTDGVKTVYCADDSYIKYFVRDYHHCDHCNVNRKRNSYFLFETDHQVIQIGSTCVKDYFGYDVDRLLHSVDLQTLFSEKNNDSFDLDEIRESVCTTFNTMYNAVLIATNNFTCWEKQTTSEFIRGILIDNKFNNWINPDQHIFDDIKKYWNDQPTTSFSINIKEAIKNQYAINKNIGIYSYAIYSYMKNIKMVNQIVNNSISFNTNDKITINKGIVTKINSYIDNTYNYNGVITYCCEFSDENNVYYRTTTTSKQFRDIVVGDKVNVSGMIKKLQVYRDKNCWLLKNCKINKQNEIIQKASHIDDPVDIMNNFMYEK